MTDSSHRIVARQAPAGHLRWRRSRARPAISTSSTAARLQHVLPRHARRLAARSSCAPSPATLHRQTEQLVRRRRRRRPDPRAATGAPSKSPFASSERTASRTAVRLTPNCSHRVRSGGRLLPRTIAPRAIFLPPPPHLIRHFGLPPHESKLTGGLYDGFRLTRLTEYGQDARPLSPLDPGASSWVRSPIRALPGRSAAQDRDRRDLRLRTSISSTARTLTPTTPAPKGTSSPPASSPWRRVRRTDPARRSVTVEPLICAATAIAAATAAPTAACA